MRHQMAPLYDGFCVFNIVLKFLGGAGNQHQVSDTFHRLGGTWLRMMMET
jgi:hypothetical protein